MQAAILRIQAEIVMIEIAAMMELGERYAAGAPATAASAARARVAWVAVVRKSA